MCMHDCAYVSMHVLICFAGIICTSTRALPHLNNSSVTISVSIVFASFALSTCLILCTV